MKRIITIVALFFAASVMWAQEGRNVASNIALDKVDYAHHGEKLSAAQAVGKVATGLSTGQTLVEASRYEDDVKNAIIKGLSGAYRFRYNDSLAWLEDVARDGDIVADANIVTIHTSSSTRSWEDSKGKTQVETLYTGVTEVVLFLKDAKSGRVLANPSFRAAGSGNAKYNTPEKAIKDALKRLSERIASWLNEYRPLQANVIEGSSAQKNKQKEIYIDLGSAEGAFAGLQMEVCTVKTVAGKEAKSQIGKLRIEAVEGEEISRCKVLSGGKEIKAALDAGEKLEVISL